MPLLFYFPLLMISVCRREDSEARRKRPKKRNNLIPKIRSRISFSRSKRRAPMSLLVERRQRPLPTAYAHAFLPRQTPSSFLDAEIFAQLHGPGFARPAQRRRRHGGINGGGAYTSYATFPDFLFSRPVSSRTRNSLITLIPAELSVPSRPS